MPDAGRDPGVQVAVIEGGAPRHQEVVVSSVMFDGTLFDQAVVVTLDRVLNDGREGDGLIGALAEMLDFRDQFHRVLREADSELLGSIGMVVCHCCWGAWWKGGRGFHQHQQES